MHLTLEVTGGTEANELKQPITVNKGVEVDNPESCPLPFTDLFVASRRQLRCFVELRRKQAQVLTNFELHSVDFSQKPGRRKPKIGRVGFRVTQMLDLSLKMPDAVECCFEFLIIREHWSPRRFR